jgi:3',5'-cyclic AMP phosphodiesterase CpdA
MVRGKRCLYFGIFLIFLTLSTIPAAAKGQQQFFFFVFADPQFGMYTDNHGFAREAENFGIAIAAANRLHPAFVIVCGDLVNQPGNPAEIAGYLQVARRLDPSIPLYEVAGNHDVGNVPTPASIHAYRKVFGRDYYSFRVQGLEGLVLDSQLVKDDSKAPAAAKAQKAWLERNLAQARAGHIRLLIDFQHIPWFLTETNEKDGYFNIPIQKRLAYLNLLRRSGVRYVLAGHYHRNAHGIYQGIKMVTIGPVGKPLGKDPSGFEMVVVSNNKLTYSYVPLSSAAELKRPVP